MLGWSMIASWRGGFVRISLLYYLVALVLGHLGVMSRDALHGLLQSEMTTEAWVLPLSPIRIQVGVKYTIRKSACLCVMYIAIKNLRSPTKRTAYD